MAHDTSQRKALADSHEWLRWLSHQDATVLLLTLVDMIETNTIEDTRDTIHAWRRSALTALDAEDWTAMVDSYIEVKVDARAYLITMGNI